MQRARDQQFDFVEVERLGHEIIGAAFHGFDRGVDRSVGCHHDADWRTRHFERAIYQNHSILAAQAQISQKDIDMFTFEHIDGTGNIGRHVDVVIIFQQTPQPVAGMFLIVHNQDGWLNGIHFAGWVTAETFILTQSLNLSIAN